MCAQTQHDVDPTTGSETWKTSAHGVALSLTQILPDQARAFYVNRGFSAEDAERFATACVYMTVLRNDAAGGTVEFVLQDWKVRSAEGVRPPLAVADWMQRWTDKGLGKPQLVAFRWAQFPPSQAYEPGDWNQGMLTTGLPAATVFDLTAHWKVGDQAFSATLEGVRCAN